MWWSWAADPHFRMNRPAYFWPVSRSSWSCAPWQLWHSKTDKAPSLVAISSQIWTLVSSAMGHRYGRRRVFYLLLRPYLLLPALNFPFSPQMTTAFTEGSALAFFSPSSKAWRTARLQQNRDSVSRHQQHPPSKRSVLWTPSSPVKMSTMSNRQSPRLAAATASPWESCP